MGTPVKKQKPGTSRQAPAARQGQQPFFPPASKPAPQKDKNKDDPQAQQKEEEASLRRDFLALFTRTDATAPGDQPAKLRLQQQINAFLAAFANYHPHYDARAELLIEDPNIARPDEAWRHNKVYSLEEANDLSARLQMIGCPRESAIFGKMGTASGSIGRFPLEQPDEKFRYYRDALLKRVSAAAPGTEAQSIALLVHGFMDMFEEAARLDPKKVQKGLEFYGQNEQEGFLDQGPYFYALSNHARRIVGSMQAILQKQEDQVIGELNRTGESPTLPLFKANLKAIETGIKPDLQTPGAKGEKPVYLHPFELQVEVTRSDFGARGGIHHDYFDKSRKAPTARFDYFDAGSTDKKEKSLPFREILDSRERQAQFLQNFYNLDDTGKKQKDKQGPRDIMGPQQNFSLFSLDDWRSFLRKKLDGMLNEQHASPAEAFTDIIRLLQYWMRAFTIHTPYDIQDRGDNYLTHDFPKAMTGQLIHDCGVYALRTVYLLSLIAPELHLKFRYILLPNHVGVLITGDQLPAVIVQNDDFHVIPLSRDQFDKMGQENRQAILPGKRLKEYEAARKNPATRDSGPVFTMEDFRKEQVASTPDKKVSDDTILSNLAASGFSPGTDQPVALSDLDARNFDPKQQKNTIKQKLWKEFGQKAAGSPIKLFSEKAMASGSADISQFNLHYLRILDQNRKFINDTLRPWWNETARQEWLALTRELEASKKKNDRKGFLQALKNYRDTFAAGSASMTKAFQPIAEEQATILERMKTGPAELLHKGIGHTEILREIPWQSALNDYLQRLDQRIRELAGPVPLDGGTDITPPFASPEDKIPYNP